MSEHPLPPKRIFPSSKTEARAAEHVPSIPQTESPAYKLAFQDTEFLLREDLRPVRFQLELLKPELFLNEAKIASTMDGDGYRHFVVCSGGGPSIMEAANRGAWEEGQETIGLNIVLPHEQLPNRYVTPDLSFQFHYFALRKMHFLLRARAVAVFPGGYGTFDELFELLTLIQTGKVRPLPILLFGRDYWNRVINFEAMVEEGVISPHDLDLIHWSEEALEAWDFVRRFYAEHPSPQPVQSSPPE
jgi:uncharacterized protein (TIGR00730 family)